VRAWRLAIASASSAQAIRTETSAVGLAMPPSCQSGVVLQTSALDAAVCNIRW
jgi:hypothetical protein